MKDARNMEKVEQLLLHQSEPVSVPTTVPKFQKVKAETGGMLNYPL